MLHDNGKSNYSLALNSIILVASSAKTIFVEIFPRFEGIVYYGTTLSENLIMSIAQNRGFSAYLLQNLCLHNFTQFCYRLRLVRIAKSLLTRFCY